MLASRGASFAINMIRTKIRYPAAAALLGLMLSQLGHMVAYVAHYGQFGLTVEAEGTHTYFPTAFSGSAGLAGSALLASLLLIGAGRLVAGKRLGFRLQRREPVWALFLISAAVQLDTYLLQEITERFLAGGTLTWQSLFDILHWGIVGQVPLAFLAAVALSWISARLPDALANLKFDWRLPSIGFHLPYSTFVPDGLGLVSLSVSTICGPAALVKRGPPSTSI
jgi:hypothetical protein